LFAGYRAPVCRTRRAFSREAALQLHVLSSFSHTIETLIQPGMKRLKVACVPVWTNGKRAPRACFAALLNSSRSLVTMLRTYAVARGGRSLSRRRTANPYSLSGYACKADRSTRRNKKIVPIVPPAS
jgi:hypothetical protein